MANNESMISENLNYTNIGNRIKEAMALNNTSISDFSVRTGVSRFSIAQWLKGNNLTTDSLCLIANELNISINWIIFGIGDLQRSSGYIPSDTETEFISICRHINHNCSQSLLALLKSLNTFNAASRSINADKLMGDFFSCSNTPVAIVQMDGAVLDCNAQFREMLGISEHLSL